MTYKPKREFYEKLQRDIAEAGERINNTPPEEIQRRILTGFVRSQGTLYNVQQAQTPSRRRGPRY